MMASPPPCSALLMESHSEWMPIVAIVDVGVSEHLTPLFLHL